MEQQRHDHRCQNCGVIWGHGNMMAADIEAHKCPKCGKPEWRHFSGLLQQTGTIRWRVYRLPGSREFWLIDSGAGTSVHKVKAIMWAVPAKTVEVGPEQNPRAWIECEGNLYIDREKAVIK